MIYFDNAATTYKKPPGVYRALMDFYKNAQANPGRSSHKLSVKASEKIYEVREKISSLYSLSSPENIVFTYNATHALNLAIKTTLKKGDHVIISDLEHNSVMRVLWALTETLKIEFDTFNSDNLSEEVLSALLKENTSAIISTLASNVTGKVIDEALLSDFSRKHGLKLILDSSQATGHRKIDLTKNTADILCAPGHKALFGLMGSGFCVFKENIRAESFIEGGSGSDSRSRQMPERLPEGYEAGTLGVPAIISLGEGIDFVKSFGEENIEHRLNKLTDELYARLSEIEKIRILGCGSGILSFVCDGVDSDLLCLEFDKKGIFTRGGLHCAPMAHKKLGTLNTGALRISLSIFNNENELDSLFKAINEIIN